MRKTTCSRCGGPRDHPDQTFCQPCYNEYHRERYQRMPGENATIQRRYNARLRAEVIAAYGGRCTCCGEATPVFLTIDHIRNDGASHRAGRGGGLWTYMDLRRRGYPQDDYQLLCRNCNWAKHALGECPHQSAA